MQRSFIPLGVLTGLALAGICAIAGRWQLVDPILLITLIVGALPLLIEIVRSMLRQHFGVDVIAIVAILASLALHQYLAGTVILLMLSGGEALEGFALQRARKELTDLIAKAPTQAHKEVNGTVIDVPIESIVVGDIVIVKPGETIPVDGMVVEGASAVDESSLTGESLPVRKQVHQHVMSGSITKESVLRIRSELPASESKYQQIIRLVREAEQHKAPFVRLADRYSVWFTAITFALAIVAWLISKDPVRSLAVLVVATPCPLILATPIAFASGISRAAKRGIIVKNGGVLEKLGEARSFVFDKTGTLTLGIPDIVETKGYGIKEEEVIAIAASLDQLSTHVLARALLQYASAKNITLSIPHDFEEKLGEGVTGTIDGTTYAFGRLRFLESLGIHIDDRARADHEHSQEQDQMDVFLASDDHVIGSIFFADRVRPNVRQLFKHLTALGIERIIMLTGDKRSRALRIAREIGIDEKNVLAESLPEQKVEIVTTLRATLAPVVMVGDGVNDAPAIAAADAGIAMGSHGSTASSQAGDIVILLDKIERVGEALFLGHRVLAIAKQSIFIGIGLSLVLMLAATLGYIVPVYGALFQEIIDVVVILNALRVLRETSSP